MQFIVVIIISLPEDIQCILAWFQCCAWRFIKWAPECPASPVLCVPPSTICYLPGQTGRQSVEAPESSSLWLPPCHAHGRVVSCWQLALTPHIVEHCVCVCCLYTCGGVVCPYCTYIYVMLTFLWMCVPVCLHIVWWWLINRSLYPAARLSSLVNLLILGNRELLCNWVPLI